MSADGRRELPDSAKQSTLICSYYVHSTLQHSQKGRRHLSFLEQLHRLPDNLTEIAVGARRCRQPPTSSWHLSAATGQAGRARTGPASQVTFVMSHTSQQFPFRQAFGDGSEGRRASSLEPGTRAGHAASSLLGRGRTLGRAGAGGASRQHQYG